MISHIKGIISEKLPPNIVIDVNGIGYEISVPMSTYFELPDEGNQVHLSTHFVVREDSQQLYGFLTKTEKTIFQKIIKINGIGPRLGLAILSSLTASEFVENIEKGQHEKLVQIPGIGKKTSERIVLELKGKLNTIGIRKTLSRNNTDLVDALIALGFSEKDANKFSKNSDMNKSLQENIKEALKNL